MAEVRVADYPASPKLAAAPGPTAIAFATADMPLESFARRADLKTPEAKKAAVEKWTEWPEVLTFDQWICNPDRHCANFLLGAPGEVYLIDHGLAFGGRDWTAATLPGQVNTVMQRLWTELLQATTDQAARVGAVPMVQKFAAKLQAIDASGACILTSLAQQIPEADRTALAAFLAARAQMAANHVCTTIGVPQLALGVIA